MGKRADGVGRTRVNARLRDVRDADAVLAMLQLPERLRDVGRALRLGSLREAQEGEQAGLHPGDHPLATLPAEAARRRGRRRQVERGGRVRVDA